MYSTPKRKKHGVRNDDEGNGNGNCRTPAAKAKLEAYGPEMYITPEPKWKSYDYEDDYEDSIASESKEDNSLAGVKQQQSDDNVTSLKTNVISMMKVLVRSKSSHGPQSSREENINGKAAEEKSKSHRQKVTVKRRRKGEEPIPRSKKQTSQDRRETSDNPFLGVDDYRLFRGNQSELLRGIAPFDTMNQGEVMCQSEYVSDIMQHFFRLECSTMPSVYMAKQPKLFLVDRSILVSKIILTQRFLELSRPTLYLSIGIVDRYLQQEEVTREQLVVVGVASIFIASKMEDVEPIDVENCILFFAPEFGEVTCSTEEVLELEKAMLKKLEYRLQVPTGYPFLLRFLCISKAGRRQELAANYYMESMLEESLYLQQRPSLIAAACVVLAVNNPSFRSGPAPGIPKELLQYTGFESRKLMKVAKEVCSKVKKEGLVWEMCYGDVAASLQSPAVAHIKGRK